MKQRLDINKKENITFFNKKGTSQVEAMLGTVNSLSTAPHVNSQFKDFEKYVILLDDSISLVNQKRPHNKIKQDFEAIWAINLIVAFEVLSLAGYKKKYKKVQLQKYAEVKNENIT